MLNEVCMTRPFLHRALQGASGSATAPLQSLRVFFNYIVIVGHTSFIAACLLDSPTDHLTFLQSSTFTAYILLLLFLFLTLSVDVFLFISGFCLMAKLAAQSNDNPALPLARLCVNRSKLPSYMLSRLLRLAPVYLLASLARAATGRSQCIAWDELLFLTALRHTSHPIISTYCLEPGWSLAPDLLGHSIILLCLMLNPRFSALPNTLYMAILTLGTMAAGTWVFAGRPGWPPGTSVMDFIVSQEQKTEECANLHMKAGAFNPMAPYMIERRERIASYDMWYSGAWFRCAPVLVGASVWLLVRHEGRVVRLLRAYPTAALGAAGGVWGGFWWRMYLKGKRNWIEEGFGRIVGSLGTAIIVIVTCGGRGREIRNWAGEVLRNRWVVALSRTTYATYLIHPAVSWVVGGLWPRLTAENLSHGLVIVCGIQWYVLSLFVSFPLCVVEEMCFVLRAWVLKAVFGEHGNEGRQDDEREKSE